MRRLVAPQVPAPSSAQTGRRCAWVCVKTAHFILAFLLLAGCIDQGIEKQLFEFDQMDAAREYHRDCLQRGKVVHVEEELYGIEVTCYNF